MLAFYFTYPCSVRRLVYNVTKSDADNFAVLERPTTPSVSFLGFVNLKLGFMYSSMTNMHTDSYVDSDARSFLPKSAVFSAEISWFDNISAEI